MLIIMLIAPCLLRSLLTRLEVAAAAGPSSPFGTYAGNSRTDLHRAMYAENSTPQERKRERGRSNRRRQRCCRDISLA